MDGLQVKVARMLQSGQQHEGNGTEAKKPMEAGICWDTVREANTAQFLHTCSAPD